MLAAFDWRQLGPNLDHFSLFANGKAALDYSGYFGTAEITGLRVDPPEKFQTQVLDLLAELEVTCLVTTVGKVPQWLNLWEGHFIFMQHSTVDFRLLSDADYLTLFGLKSHPAKRTYELFQHATSLS